MSVQNSDPGSRSQTFASYKKKPPLGGFIIGDQANKARPLQSTRCSSAVTSLALTAFLAGAPELAVAQNIQDNGSAAARAGAIAHAQKMRRLFPDINTETQTSPPVIPQLQIDPDPSGAIATFQPNGPTITVNNAFFQNLGSNGRTCFTCHQPQDGWSLSAQHALERFYADPDEPLFRLVDGATCPSADVSTYAKKREAYRLLVEKGLIRVGLPMPSDGLQFQIVGVSDPYGCNTNPLTGLTGSTTGTVSVYRRPLPSANLGFLSTIMWDGREPSLFSQAVSATRGHAQGTVVPSAAQQQQIVSFEGCTHALTPTLCANIPATGGVFTAQISDDTGIDLSRAGGNGGPVALSKEVAKFFIGINDPLGLNPTGVPFDPQVFDLYSNWSSRSVPGDRRQAIARGEELFNSTKINITGVGGLNDALNQSSISGTCTTCHDTPNVGNHSVTAPLSIGVADAGKESPPALDISKLPVFTIWCTSGRLAGKMFEVTDPGRALITGNCADIGKVKGPLLRGLAARAPYFHNGSAARLSDVVDFYDQRFGMQFTDQQKADLVAFLSSL